MHGYDVEAAGRAGDALFLDGAQVPFNTTSPASPGFLFVSPRRTGPIPWFEFFGSFTMEVWIRPTKLFFGTDIEGGIVGCLARDRVNGLYSGYGITTTSSSLVNFIITIQNSQHTLSANISSGVWTHVGVSFNTTSGKAALYTNGTLRSEKFVGTGRVDFEPPNDFLIGKLQYLDEDNRADYFAGYLDEMRVWSRVIPADEMRYSGYETKPPNLEVGQPELKYALGVGDLASYWPFNRIQCTPQRCRNDNQRFSEVDGSYRLGSSPNNAPKCLSVPNAATELGTVIEITACADSDHMKWGVMSGFGVGNLLMVQHLQSQQIQACLSVQPNPPWAGRNVKIELCNLDATGSTNQHQQWIQNQDESLRNVLSGLCLTAPKAENGARLYLINCFEVGTTAVLESLALDVMENQRHGVLTGGVQLVPSNTPIDMSPWIDSVAGVDARYRTSTDPVILHTTVGQTLQFSVVGFDPNGLDMVVVTHSELPDGATMSEMIPTNPATRVFTWTPLMSGVWDNPSVVVIRAQDQPANPVDPENVNLPLMSQDIVVQIEIAIPPVYIDPTPEDGLILYTQINNVTGFTVGAMDRNPDDSVRIFFAEEGRDYPAPQRSKLIVSDNIPSVGSDNITRLNPTTRTWSFFPTQDDAGRSFQICFVARTDNQLIGYETAVRCVTLVVAGTDPVFDDGSIQAGDSYLASVGCDMSFRVSARRNDTNEYSVQIRVKGSSFQPTRNDPVEYPAKLPPGSSLVELDSSEVAGPAGLGLRVLEFQWKPQLGQEGSWGVCIEVYDPFEVTVKTRCVSIRVRKCRYCVGPGSTLESVAMSLNVHWLELWTLNVAMGNPEALRPGTLLNTGVTYKVGKAQKLSELALALGTRTERLLERNPDLVSNDVDLLEGDELCVVPTMCDNDCADGELCERKVS